VSDNRFVFTGLAELHAELRRLPAALQEEARDIIQSHAREAADSVTAVYAQHAVTHHLERSVEVVEERSLYGAAVRVRVKDPIAWLFDNGSAARHWDSGKSTGTMWGKTAPTHVFVKTMIKVRGKMWQALSSLVARAGLEVTGRAE